MRAATLSSDVVIYDIVHAGKKEGSERYMFYNAYFMKSREKETLFRFITIDIKDKKYEYTVDKYVNAIGKDALIRSAEESKRVKNILTFYIDGNINNAIVEESRLSYDGELIYTKMRGYDLRENMFLLLR